MKKICELTPLEPVELGDSMSIQPIQPFASLIYPQAWWSVAKASAVNLRLIFEQEKLAITIQDPAFAPQPALCGGCHNSIFEQWQGGVHANALNDPIFQKATKLFLSEVETEGDREDARSCVRCHTPLGHLSKVIETTEADYDNAMLENRSGIFCSRCIETRISYIH